MMVGGNFTFSVVEEKAHRRRATVGISREHVSALYNEAVLAQKNQAQTYGFLKGTTPIQYIEQNFRSNIVEHLKELLFTHCVIHFLYASLSENKIVVAGDPDLVDIRLQPEGDAEFVFSFLNVNLDGEARWKRLALRPIERQNYKDLDRMVQVFIKEENEKRSGYVDNGIQVDDWVHFGISILNKDNKELINNYKSDLWIRIQGEEDDRDLHELFLGKRVGDVFTTQSVFLQEYISHTNDMNYTFLVEIKDCLPHVYFALDDFMHHFELKDDAELAAKLVEVFSMRNDISLRRETIEAVFKLLSKQHYFLLPGYLLERQRALVLQEVQDNPDYHVYKAQADFKERIKQLAEKQLKEAIIIDAIAYQEGLTATNDDVRAYLNLLKRPRMKSFVYFLIPMIKVQGQEVPLSTELIKRYCLREKTLNYVIKQLTKKIK